MIHQYKLNGYNIVLDVYSGSVHLVDEVAYDIIALYETTPQEEIVAQMLAKYGHRDDVDEGEILDCLADIQALKQAGKLFSQDLWKDVEQEAFQHTKPVLKAMCLHVAHTCNLNCDYCFASQGNYHGDRGLMPFAVGKQALDFLIASSGSRVNLEVDFFGGEPLMNWQVVKDLVAYARTQEPIHHKKFRFTLTTNGMLIDDDVIDFCNKECHNVVLSLDGRKEVHDRFRKDYAGHGKVIGAKQIECPLRQPQCHKQMIQHPHQVVEHVSENGAGYHHGHQIWKQHKGTHKRAQRHVPVQQHGKQRAQHRAGNQRAEGVKDGARQAYPEIGVEHHALKVS